MSLKKIAGKPLEDLEEIASERQEVLAYVGRPDSYCLSNSIIAAGLVFSALYLGASFCNVYMHANIIDLTLQTSIPISLVAGVLTYVLQGEQGRA